MQVIFEINEHFMRVDTLKKTVRDYNNFKHATKGMKPTQVNKNKQKELIKIYGV